MSRLLLIAGGIALAAVAQPAPASAGSEANSRWYSNANVNSLIVRAGGEFRVVDRKSGYILYDDGTCRRLAKSAHPPLASRLKSKLVHFCTRDQKHTPKWSWTEAEFHLTSEGGRDVWRLFWLDETMRGKGLRLGLDKKIKASRVVPEYASYDQVLDGIACTVSFERYGDGTEALRPNSPFGDCAIGKLKGAEVEAGEYACEAGVDPTFLGRRAVRIVNKGDAGKPQLYLSVEGREPKACRIVPSKF